MVGTHMMVDDFDISESFPHPVDTLHWRETHISWILLTGKFVYKIKKPVDFGFLDFSSLEKRKHFCEEELRLNQRTAPQWYLSVEPLFCVETHSGSASADSGGEGGCTKGGLNFCGRGTVVDYAVKMTQFDPDAVLLDEMKRRTLPPEFFYHLGADLAVFHQQVDVDEHGTLHGGLERIWNPVQENVRQIEPLLQNEQQREQLQHQAAWAESVFEQLTSCFKQRMAEGKVRECHGDLHMGNIAVIDTNALLFDCIEFNQQLRWIDVASDLAFLIMDMQFHDYPAQANAVLNQYLVTSCDYYLLPVLRFYMAYRAMVRAKVSILRQSQTDLDLRQKRALQQQFDAYLDFACQQSQAKRAPLVLTCGVSGTGKSTFAKQLAEIVGAIHLRSDVVRKQLAGLKPLQLSDSEPSQLHQGIYTPQFSEKTFSYLAQLVELCLRNGFPVIVDATFLSPRHRQRFLELGEQFAQQNTIVHFQVPYQTLVERIRARQARRDDPSEATVAVLDQQLEQQQGFTSHELPLVVEGYNGAGEFDFASVLERMAAGC